MCGRSSPNRCSRCTKVHYCSKEHQTHDWVVGHKKYCRDISSGKLSVGDLKYNPNMGISLPEYEIVTELEPDLTTLGNEKLERSEEECMADYHKYIKSVRGVASGKGGGASELSSKALKDAAMSEHNIDKQFKVFKKRVAIEPEQHCPP